MPRDQPSVGFWLCHITPKSTEGCLWPCFLLCLWMEISSSARWTPWARPLQSHTETSTQNRSAEFLKMGFWEKQDHCSTSLVWFTLLWSCSLQAWFLSQFIPVNPFIPVYPYSLYLYIHSCSQTKGVPHYAADSTFPSVRANEGKNRQIVLIWN